MSEELAVLVVKQEFCQVSNVTDSDALDSTKERLDLMVEYWSTLVELEETEKVFYCHSIALLKVSILGPLFMGEDSLLVRIEAIRQGLESVDWQSDSFSKVLGDAEMRIDAMNELWPTTALLINVMPTIKVWETLITDKDISQQVLETMMHTIAISNGNVSLSDLTDCGALKYISIINRGCKAIIHERHLKEELRSLDIDTQACIVTLRTQNIEGQSLFKLQWNPKDVNMVEEGILWTLLEKTESKVNALKVKGWSTTTSKSVLEQIALWEGHLGVFKDWVREMEILATQTSSVRGLGLSSVQRDVVISANRLLGLCRTGINQKELLLKELILLVFKSNSSEPGETDSLFTPNSDLLQHITDALKQILMQTQNQVQY